MQGCRPAVHGDFIPESTPIRPAAAQAGQPPPLPPYRYGPPRPIQHPAPPVLFYLPGWILNWMQARGLLQQQPAGGPGGSAD